MAARQGSPPSQPLFDWNSLPSANVTRTSASPLSRVQDDALHVMEIARMDFEGGTPSTVDAARLRQTSIAIPVHEGAGTGAGSPA